MIEMSKISFFSRRVYGN